MSVLSCLSTNSTVNHESSTKQDRHASEFYALKTRATNNKHLALVEATYSIPDSRSLHYPWAAYLTQVQPRVKPRHPWRGLHRGLQGRDARRQVHPRQELPVQLRRLRRQDPCGVDRSDDPLDRPAPGGRMLRRQLTSSMIELPAVCEPPTHSSTRLDHLLSSLFATRDRHFDVIMHGRLVICIHTSTFITVRYSKRGCTKLVE